MALIAKDGGGGGEFTPVPEGMHLARCYRIVDLGTQESKWLNTIKHLHKIMIQFEVHGEDDAGNPIVTTNGEPMSISKNYTLSLGDMANLRKDLQTWRGREFSRDELLGFELKNILGAWAMISVIKKAGDDGKEYTNIVGVMAVPTLVKKSGLPDGHNDLQMFDIESPDMKMFDSFGKKLQAKIEKSPEWQSRGKSSNPAKTSAGSFDDMESDIPF